MSMSVPETTAELAQQLRTYVAPFCDLVLVAGSIRRGKPDPKDIELVAVPQYGQRTVTDMFGQAHPTGTVSFLDAALEELYKTGPWNLDRQNPKNGPRYKRLRHSLADKACDLFITTHDSFGVQLAIRTGPAAYSKYLAGRCKTRGYQMDEGQLWRVHNDGKREPVAVRTEEHFFHLLGLEWLPPEDRRA